MYQVGRFFAKLAAGGIAIPQITNGVTTVSVPSVVPLSQVNSLSVKCFLFRLPFCSQEFSCPSKIDPPSSEGLMHHWHMVLGRPAGSFTAVGLTSSLPGNSKEGPGQDRDV